MMNIYIYIYIYIYIKLERTECDPEIFIGDVNDANEFIYYERRYMKNMSLKTKHFWLTIVI